ncbi:Predicted metal-dependent enzyme [Sebaldella termitidis]|uniref:DUF1385 domain-containing protein n=2 Tax=Sebaldella TaxID=32068 RepID=D1ALG6_SEBTE|nr:protein of unknown function DUF1385 [Sebaldella termitidis ATCC 33386]SUI24630.1 Predicted metal-dependent enzyme [Sebaldella termitidis]
MDNKVVVGGQAVIEGVMMRGPKAIATAVRRKDGTIVYRKKTLDEKKNKWFKMPFIRGVLALFDAMVIGTKELIFASNQAGEEEEQLSDKEVMGTVSMSLIIGIGVFMVIPSLVGGLVFKDNKLMANIIEAAIRLIMFLGYIWGISFFKDVRRVFEYHGAEHKSIYNYEMEKALEVENAKTCTRFHPRCGTSFLLLVMFISILVFSIVDFIFPVPDNKFLLIVYKIFTRIPFVPVVAGISFEIQRWTSYHLNNIIGKMIAGPGLLLQKITTKEPDESQLEVALVALKVALGQEVTNAVEVEN